ncbi:hypothetical protein SNE40_013102 [Patella caerulea]
MHSLRATVGAVGLTENHGALRRWMVAGPEIARKVEEFEDGFDEDETTPNVTCLDRHHEQTKSVQEKFVHDIRSLVTTNEEMGNPFMEESMDLLNLNSKVVMPEKVVKDLKNLYLLGKEKYYQFMESISIRSQLETPFHATNWSCLASLELRRPRQQGG